MAFFNTALNWIVAHWAGLSATLALIINELIALNPKLKSSSLVQWLLSFLGMGPGAK